MSEPDLRIGDAERDEVASLLAHHFAAGRLSRSEFDERTEQVLGARTRSEVDQVVVDLPVTPADERPSVAVDSASAGEPHTELPRSGVAESWPRGLCSACSSWCCGH